MSGKRGGWVRPVCFLLGLAVTGCGGLLPDPPKRQLYRLEPALAVPPSAPRNPAQLLVAVPVAPAGLDTSRIALSRTPVSLDYFADAEWTDRAPLLLQTALIDAFAKSAAFAGVARDSAALRADLVLETEIRAFQAGYDSPTGPPRVSIGLTARLVKFPERKIVGQTSVTQQSAAAANDVADIVRAYDEAVGAAVSQVVAWAVTNSGLSPRRISLNSRTRFVHAL